VARKLKTGWVRVATSGPTVDGSDRVIEKQWLKSMAKNYDPEIYTAKIYPDHYRWLPCGGDVLALKTMPTTNEKLEGEIHLMAIISPNDWLIEQNRNGQYCNPSIELRENFMDGKFDFYLGGLGVTDAEGSAGTSKLEFCAKEDKPDRVFSGDALNLADSVRKNFFSGLTLTSKPDDDEMKPEQFEAFTALLKQNQTTLEAMASNFTAMNEKIEALAKDDSEPSGGDEAGKVDESEEAKAFKALTAQLETVTGELAEMKDKFSALENAPAGGTIVPEADGSDDEASSEIL